MANKRDNMRAGYEPLLARTLQNALAYRIEKEFPRIGGPRIRQLCAEMVLEVVHNHIRNAETLHHGQIVWTAISTDHPPVKRKRITETDLVTVILDLCTPEDVHARIDRIPEYQRKTQKALRLCYQAYEQGGVLSNFDLSELLSLSNSTVARHLLTYERENLQVVPRRATIHDIGTGLSHKWIICYKRYVEGKSPDLIAQETYHSQESVDRYLADYDRVRHCRLQGFSPVETAHILNCGVSLVKAYIQIDLSLEGKDA